MVVNDELAIGLDQIILKSIIYAVFFKIWYLVKQKPGNNDLLQMTSG